MPTHPAVDLMDQPHGCSKLTDQDQQVQSSRFAFLLMPTLKSVLFLTKVHVRYTYLISIPSSNYYLSARTLEQTQWHQKRVEYHSSLRRSQI